MTTQPQSGKYRPVTPLVITDGSLNTPQKALPPLNPISLQRSVTP